MITNNHVHIWVVAEWTQACFIIKNSIVPSMYSVRDRRGTCSTMQADTYLHALQPIVVPMASLRAIVPLFSVKLKCLVWIMHEKHCWFMLFLPVLLLEQVKYFSLCKINVFKHDPRRLTLMYNHQLRDPPESTRTQQTTIYSLRYIIYITATVNSPQRTHKVYNWHSDSINEPWGL